MKKNSPKAPQVVLRRPHTAVAVLALAKAIYDALETNKGMFPSPNPPMPTFLADINAFDVAQTATHTRTKGTVEARDAKLAVVLSDLGQIRAYVQKVVDADPANAATIAQNAGLSLRKSSARSKTDLSAKPNKKVSGSVDVVVKVGGVKASHEWQYSTDGKSWTNASPTMQAKTTIPGFTPGTTVFFRHRAVTKTGPDNWSQAVSMIVV